MQKNIVSAVNQAMGAQSPSSKKEPLSDSVSTEAELSGLKEEVSTLEVHNQSLSETLSKLETENSSLQKELDKLRKKLTSATVKKTKNNKKTKQ
jgi:regulator of replication initiation timing